jgi:hypothetical protein
MIAKSPKGSTDQALRRLLFAPVVGAAAGLAAGTGVTIGRAIKWGWIIATNDVYLTQSKGFFWLTTVCCTILALFIQPTAKRPERSQFIDGGSCDLK